MQASLLPRLGVTLNTTKHSLIHVLVQHFSVLSIFATFYYDIFGKNLEHHIVYIENLESLLAIAKKHEETQFSEHVANMPQLK